MRVGIMGGTFDPIHTGHLIVGERARVGAGLDQVWFMPTNISPHKRGAPIASAAQRWDMVCRAIEGNPHFFPTDIEIQKGGVSYSIDTIELLIERHPDAQFAYIIGADMVQYLPKWHRIEEIVQKVRFVGLERPGCQLQMDLLPATIQAVLQMVFMPQVDISSSAIRQERQNRGSIRYWVPDQVYEYIEVNGLYGS
jgi:nicotinate-nucleotide adenylyltransferase